MKHQGIIFTTADCGIGALRIAGWIEIAGVGVGVAVDGGAGAIQNLLHRFDRNDLLGGGDVNAARRDFDGGA